MFLQARPWLDCDRGCDFCYLKENEKHTTIEYKRKSLMNLLRVFGADTLRTEDTVGLIGGELFCFEGLKPEWRCVADMLCSIKPSRVFLGTHLLSGVDTLLWFAKMVSRCKEVQICTSYDTTGRFRSDEEREEWFRNLEKVHDAGYHIAVSCTMTDEFINDPVEFPEWVDLKLQPIFVTEPWLRDQMLKHPNSEQYHKNLIQDMSGTTLAKREDVLKWFRTHPASAKSYSCYSDKHATALADFNGNEYICEDFICNHLADCGHPLIGFCYADSDKCSLCDASEAFDDN